MIDYNIHDDGFYDFILKLLKIEVKMWSIQVS